MIQKAKFLGVSIHDRSRRRALVLAYYGLMLLILSVGLYKQRFLPMAVIIQTLTLGGFFGGIRSEGVVKPYSENTPTPGESGIQQLNLNGIRPFTAGRMLDERELHERDAAHYTAYRILRWSLLPFFVIFLFGFGIDSATGFAHGFFSRNLLNILWFTCIFVLSLPQSVILWTEPQALPDAEMGLAATYR